MADARSGSCSSTAKRVSRDRSRSDSSCTIASVVTRPFHLIFAGHNFPQLRLDLRQPSMNVIDAGFFVLISEFHIDQPEHPPNVFEDATLRGLDRFVRDFWPLDTSYPRGSTGATPNSAKGYLLSEKNRR